MRVRQSDLASYARCAQQKKLTDLQRAGELDKAPEQLSMTAYGSVLHYGIHILEKLRQEGRDDALDVAKATFEYYWHPDHTHQICEPVTIWAARQTFSSLLRKGLATLDLYNDHLDKDTGRLLGLEVEFNLPFVLDGEEHVFHGTMDRLSLRKTGSNTYLNIEDFKSGKTPDHLRWNAQFSGYAWATTQEGFWEPWGDPEIFTRFSTLSRRGTWISLRSGIDRKDAGWRGPQDYARFWACVREYVKAVKADIYPLSLKGDVCEYCPFREGICGGVAVPDYDHGRPAPKAVSA